jgi:hypothetical protein
VIAAHGHSLRGFLFPTAKPTADFLPRHFHTERPDREHLPQANRLCLAFDTRPTDRLFVQNPGNAQGCSGCSESPILHCGGMGRTLESGTKLSPLRNAPGIS